MNSIKQLSKTAEQFFAKSSKPVVTVFDKYLSPVITQPYVKLIILYITIVSIILSVNHLPMKLKLALDHHVSKVIITFLGVYVYTEDLYVSLTAALALLVVYYTVNSMVVESLSMAIYNKMK